MYCEHAYYTTEKYAEPYSDYIGGIAGLVNITDFRPRLIDFPLKTYYSENISCLKPGPGKYRYAYICTDNTLYRYAVHEFFCP